MNDNIDIKVNVIFVLKIGGIMSKAEKIMKKKSFIKEDIRKSFPDEPVDILWRKATDKLDEILKRYEAIPEGYRIHTDKHIFPSAAIYLVMKEELGEDKAYDLIEHAAVVRTEKVAKILSGLMKLPGMPSLFIKMWDPMTKKMFSEDNGFKNVFYPETRNEYRMDVTACPYCRFFKELGCFELTKIFCANDDRVYGNLPGVEFIRESTLGNGADHCDFYARKIR